MPRKITGCQNTNGVRTPKEAYTPFILDLDRPSQGKRLGREQRNKEAFLRSQEEGRDWLFTWSRNAQKSMTSMDTSSETSCFPSPPKGDQAGIGRVREV